MTHKADGEALFLLHRGGTEDSKVSIHTCRAEAELSRHIQALLPGTRVRNAKPEVLVSAMQEGGECLA